MGRSKSDSSSKDLSIGPSFQQLLHHSKFISTDFIISRFNVDGDKIHFGAASDLSTDGLLKQFISALNNDLFRIALRGHGINPFMQDNQYTPTVVVFANTWNGRVPEMPSHGYFSCGFSRSPSSRSMKPGMKSSLVMVYSFTRPVSP